MEVGKQATFRLALNFLAEQISKGSVQGLLRLEVEVLIILLPHNHSVRCLSLLIYHAQIKNVAAICPARYLG